MDIPISREAAGPRPPITGDADRSRAVRSRAVRSGAELAAAAQGAGAEGGEELRETFQDFVGQTLFGSMLASMRKTVGKPAYLHGGRTEEVFQKQLDRYIVEDLTESSAETISDPMFELFSLQRRA